MAPTSAMELPLTLGEALLGGEVSIDALGGRTLLLTIPAVHPERPRHPSRWPGPAAGPRAGGRPARAHQRGAAHGLDEEGRALARAFIDHIDQPDPRAGRPRARSR